MAARTPLQVLINAALDEIDIIFPERCLRMTGGLHGGCLGEARDGRRLLVRLLRACCCQSKEAQ